MTTSRREFFKRGSLFVASGLLGIDALKEAFERMSHVRKAFPSSPIPRQIEVTASTLAYISSPWEVVVPNEGVKPILITVDGKPYHYRVRVDYGLPPDRIMILDNRVESDLRVGGV